MSLLRGNSSLVKRILSINPLKSRFLQVTQQSRHISDKTPDLTVVPDPSEYSADNPPSGFDFTHLEGDDCIETLNLDAPLTPEKRIQLAAKYNLRPEDYVPLNDHEITLGDYPKLPVENALERDPYYDWDDPFYRRNFGEPIFEDQEFYTPVLGCDTRPLIYDRSQMWKIWLKVMFGFIVLFIIGEKYYFFLPRAPKQYPEYFPGDELVYTKDFDWIENRGTDKASVRERKQVAHYAFPKGWDPLAH